MAQFDVHRLVEGNGLVINCQSELLDHLNTRLVVPLIPRADAPAPALRLNPIFVIDGDEYVMATQFASAVRHRELGDAIASLGAQGFEITGAVDVLLSGV